MLYPHFTDSITPGWFDKLFKRRANPENQARTLLLSPSQDYLQSLPLGRLPDRKDFTLKGLDQKQRIQMWNQCISESQRLGDESWKWWKTAFCTGHTRFYINKICA